MIVGRTINYNRLRNPVAAHRARGAVSDPLRALIAQLFGNGEQGAMYIPKPQVLGQQVLYQDAAGTVPVTADGDPVGLMLDLSGNVNHASQSTSAARMAYSGGYLVPDGVDDNIDIPIGSGFVGDFALILSTGPVFGSIDTATDSGWAYTKNPVYIPDGDIHAIVVLDRALTTTEKQRIVSHFSEGIISRPSTAINAFRDRTDLTALDTSYGDWTQVNDAVSAFFGCSSLTTPPDVSGWTQVNNAGSAFRDCSSLTTPPDVSGWTQVTSASNAFFGCSSLTTPPDVSGWTRVTRAASAFRDCSSLTTPPDVSGWTRVMRAGSAFRDCSSLTNAVDLSNWNPTLLTDATLMMHGISAAGFDQAAYDAALTAWDTNYDLSTVNAISIDFGNAKYTAGGAAEAARTQLVNVGWTITDGGAA